jgi:hypothetical protein
MVWNGGAYESSDEVNKQVAGDRDGVTYASVYLCLCGVSVSGLHGNAYCCSRAWQDLSHK